MSAERALTLAAEHRASAALEVGEVREQSLQQAAELEGYAESLRELGE